jgi:hypothetical protein
MRIATGTPLHIPHAAGSRDMTDGTAIPHPHCAHSRSGGAITTATQPPHPPNPRQPPHHAPRTTTSQPPHRRAAAPRGTPAPPARRRRAHPLVRAQQVSATPGRRMGWDDRGSGARDCVAFSPPRSRAGLGPLPPVWPARRLAPAAPAGPPRVACRAGARFVAAAPPVYRRARGCNVVPVTPPPPCPARHRRAHAVARPAQTRKPAWCVRAVRNGERRREAVRCRGA